MRPRPHPPATPTAAEGVPAGETADRSPDALSVPLRVVGLVVYGLLGALSAAFEVLLVPSRIGSTLVPVAVVLAVGGNVALPRLAMTFTRSAVGAVVPVVTWIVVLATLSSNRPEGDVLLPGGGTVQYVSYGVMIGGLLSGLLTLGVLTGAGQRRGVDHDQPGPPVSTPGGDRRR